MGGAAVLAAVVAVHRLPHRDALRPAAVSDRPPADTGPMVGGWTARTGPTLTALAALRLEVNRAMDAVQVGGTVPYALEVAVRDVLEAHGCTCPRRAAHRLVCPLVARRVTAAPDPQGVGAALPSAVAAVVPAGVPGQVLPRLGFP